MVLCVCGFIIGCTPVEKQAYQSVVAGKAFLDSVKSKHPECPGPGVVCTSLVKATAAKDLIIDAGEAYCRVDAFPNTDTTPCNPYPKGTDKYSLTFGALGSALRGWDQAETNLKGLVK